MPIGTDNGDHFEDGMDLRAQQRLYVTPIRDNAPEGPEKGFQIPLRRYPLDTEDQNIISPGRQGEPGGDNLTRDKNEYNPEDIENNYFVKDYYPKLYPIAGPAETEPLVRHKVDQSTPNLLQKALGIGTQGDRYQMWPERAARGMAAGAQQEGQGIFHALTGMLNPSFEEDKAILQGFYNTVKNVFSLPHDVYGGTIDPMSPMGIERANDLAQLMVFGPRPIASKMANGTLGSFGGVGAKTADTGMLEKAQAFEKAGMDPDEIWQMTNWWRAPDNRWKFQISPAGSHMKPEGLELHGEKPMELMRSKFKIPPEEYTGKIKPDEKTGDLLERKITFLDQIFHHPELFKAYPELKDIQIVPLAKELEAEGIGGRMRIADNTMEMSPSTLSDMHSMILHEIQHVIQAREGFSAGSSTHAYRTEFWNDMMEEFAQHKANVGNRLNAKFGNNAIDKFFNYYNAIKNENLLKESYNSWTTTMNKQEFNNLKDALTEAKARGFYRDMRKIVKGEDIVSRHKDLANEQYWYTRGEVEARNVQDRLYGWHHLAPEIAEKKFAKEGISLDTTYGKAGAPNEYRLRHWNTDYKDERNYINPEDLPEYLKDTWRHLTVGKPKGQVYPGYTQSIPPEKQVWSPWDTIGIKMRGRRGISESRNYPRIPKNVKEELDQLIENKRTNRLMGYNTEGPDYQYYNDKINELKAKLREK